MKIIRIISIGLFLLLFLASCEDSQVADSETEALEELISTQQELLDYYISLLGEQEIDYDDLEPELLRETLRSQQALLNVYQDEITQLEAQIKLLEVDVEQGDYKPGMYFGYTDGHQNTIAVVNINENGVISNIFVDSIYMKATNEEGDPVNWVSRGNETSGYATTKMSLDYGCGYVMHRAAAVTGTPPNCEADGELMWHLQVRALIEDIIEKQEISSYDFDGHYFDHDGGDDVVAGVTISVDSYLAAIKNALDQARP